MRKSDKPLVVFLGPAHPYRGGIASFSNRLAHEFNQHDWQSIVYTFSLQYPNFLFPGKTQYATEPERYGLEIQQAVNSINPLNWIKVGNELNRLAPDLIIVRYWLPFMAPAFGSILRLAKRNRKTKVICIADNIIPHEKRLGDAVLTQYFQSSVDGFVAMSEQVMNDLRKLNIDKPRILLSHPLFDHFGEKIDQQQAKQTLGRLPRPEHPRRGEHPANRRGDQGPSGGRGSAQAADQLRRCRPSLQRRAGAADHDQQPDPGAQGPAPPEQHRPPDLPGLRHHQAQQALRDPRLGREGPGEFPITHARPGVTAGIRQAGGSSVARVEPIRIRQR